MMAKWGKLRALLETRMLENTPFAAPIRNTASLNGRPAQPFSGEHKQTIVRTLIIGAILAIGTNTALAAGSEIGTWKLNLAKSTYSPGPAPKSQTRTYAESAQGMTVTIKTMAADGKETASTSNIKDDGKPYAVSGNTDFDMVSLTRVDASTVRITQIKAGATVATGVRTVSKDGKTLTVALKGTRANGKFEDVLVFDRQ
jgi:hypothetical protein